MGAVALDDAATIYGDVCKSYLPYIAVARLIGYVIVLGFSFAEDSFRYDCIGCNRVLTAARTQVISSVFTDRDQVMPEKRLVSTIELKKSSK